LIARGAAKEKTHFRGFHCTQRSRMPVMGAVAAILGCCKTKGSAKCSQVSCVRRPLGAPELDFLNHITIKPYGVLGNGQDIHGKMFDANAAPDGNVAVVDPAGLHHIQPPGGPRGAGGAAGACYKWLGIHRDRAFPAEVVAAVQNTGDAKYHFYSEDKKVIHAVGPDFRRQEYSEDEAVQELAIVYKNIFCEFINSEVATLRLLPVSGGIFAGSHQRRIHALTFAALDEAFLKLSGEQQEELMKRDVHLCLFMEKDMEEFTEALERFKSPTEENGVTQME